MMAASQSRTRTEKTFSPMHTLTAKEETTLFILLAGAGYSRSKVKQLLAHGAIAAGAITLKRGDLPLAAGTPVVIKTEREVENDRRRSPLPIVYEDEAIILVNKPSGLLSVSTAEEKERTAFCRINNFIREREGQADLRIFVVHRLDRDTSGLLLFAKSEAVRHRLQEQWPQTSKRYAALVEGVPKERSGEIRSHLKESKALKVHSVHDGEGSPSITRYELIQAGGGYALLSVAISTGRKNQIRVHLAELGHPLAGDKKYGAVTNPIGRLALHAELLGFPHPISGESCEFKVPIPGRFFEPLSDTAHPHDGAGPSSKTPYGGNVMSKGQDIKKETKKTPAKSPKEKKAAKQLKKADKSRG